MIRHPIPTIACALLWAGALASPAHAADSITLSGCLIRATDGSGYLIANAPAQPARTSGDDDKVAPNAFGGTNEFSAVFYWLENDASLKPHVGHRVEVRGDLKAPQDGELDVDRKDQWTELELKSDGRTMHANVPNTSVLPPASDSKDTKSKVTVRRVSVEKVKMLGATCAP